MIKKTKLLISLNAIAFLGFSQSDVKSQISIQQDVVVADIHPATIDAQYSSQLNSNEIPTSGDKDLSEFKKEEFGIKEDNIQPKTEK